MTSHDMYPEEKQWKHDMENWRYKRKTMSRTLFDWHSEINVYVVAKYHSHIQHPQL